MIESSGITFQQIGRYVRRAALTSAAIVLLAQIPGLVAAAEPEHALAGIYILSPGASVTRKFGNPDRILVGGVAPASPSAGGAGSGSGAGPSSPTGGMPGGGAPGQLPGFPSGISGAPSEFGGSGAPGGLPGAPGGLGGASGGTAAPVKQEVTLIYDHLVPNGGSLEFTISPDKRVIQIRETGFSGQYRTGRGVALGITYSGVIAKYGYPEDTTISGSIINTDYKDTYHCGFQFLDQKLVGIIVAAVE